MTRFRITHRTTYAYDAPVTSSYAQVHQSPWDVDGQRCLERSITADPTAAHQRTRTDYFGNPVVFLSIDTSHTELVVTSASVVDTTERAARFPDSAEVSWERIVRALASETDLIASDHAVDSPLVSRSERLEKYARSVFTPGRPVGEAVGALSATIHRDFEFKPGSTEVSTTIDQVMDLRKGVCQDFAHVMIGCLRAVGLPPGT
jgi:transglutaminase-like putative cysteine protease